MLQPGRWVLGLSASHNGAACLVHDGRIVVAMQEERLSGVKRDRTYGAQPSLAVSYCLDAAGIDASRLDLVVLCAQGRATSRDHDLALNPQLRLISNRVPWLVISHHLGHAVSAYATSGFREAAVLVIDGLGSPAEDLSDAERRCAPDVEDGWETLSVYRAADHVLTPVVKQLVAHGRWLERTGSGMPRFASLGGMYSAVATQIFGDPMEAGKVMGLAPYGTPVLGAERFLSCAGSAVAFLDDVPRMFQFADKWPARGEQYADLAASVQGALEHALRSVVGDLRHRLDSANLCYAGGVALNCTANEMLWRESGFENVYVPPPAEDSGPAIGAAFYGLWDLTRRHCAVTLRRDGLGRSYPTEDIDSAVAAMPGVRTATTDRDEIASAAAARLSDGQVGGWFVGGAELGPRALGCRSNIADPRPAPMKAPVTADATRREQFRPLAPAVLVECAHEWFDNQGAVSPFMLRSWRFRPERAAEVAAVIHVDGTGRVQTVEQSQQPRFHALIREFHRLTAVPMLLNTSFNGPGEPIVETPSDALWCMLGLGLDFVVLQDRIVEPDPGAPDLLGLVPKLACERYSVRLSTGPTDDPREESGSVLTVRVETTWGRCERPVPPPLARVLSAVDGVSTGHDIQRRLPADAPAVPDAIRLLARRRVIRLLAPPG
jgi:carbamoyltransferase